MKRFILLVAIMSFILIGCQKIVYKEHETVMGTVTNMKYKKSYDRLIPLRSGKVTFWARRSYPERFLVTITYNDLSETFDSRELYENVKIGDNIPMELNSGYDEDYNLITRQLNLPE